MPKTKVPTIKPVENYSNMPEAEIINRASAVYAGLNGSTHFTNLPVPMADFKAQIDSVSALMAEAIEWITKELSSAKGTITLDGLTPGTLYGFDARAFVNDQWTDYGDPVTFMCT